MSQSPDKSVHAESAPADESLEAQLDRLLTHIEEQRHDMDEAIGVRERIARRQAAEVGESDEAESADQAEPDDSGDVGDDTLTDQIQSLLDAAEDDDDQGGDASADDDGPVQAARREPSAATVEAEDAPAATDQAEPTQEQDLTAQLQALLDQKAALSESDASDASPEGSPTDSQPVPVQNAATDAISESPAHPSEKHADAAAKESATASDAGVESAADATAAKTNATQDDIVGEALADQIQALLDESKSREATDTPNATADVEPAREAPAEGETIGAIDQFLAEQADELVGGDFETVGETLQREGVAEPDASVVEPGPEEANRGALADRLGSEPQEHLDEDAFAPPDALIEGDSDPHLDGYFATAEDVASELDDQPEQRATVDEAKGSEAEQAKAPGARPRPEGLASGGSPEPWSAVADVLADLTFHVCALINRPLSQFSPQTRHAIGYFAIIQVFVGSALLIGKAASWLAG